MQAASLWNILRVVQSLHQRQVAHFDLSPSQFAWFTGEISEESSKMHWQLWLRTKHSRAWASTSNMVTSTYACLPAEVTLQADGAAPLKATEVLSPVTLSWDL